MSQRSRTHKITVRCVILFAVAAIILCVFLGNFTGLPANKRHITYTIGPSSRFSKQQLHQAADKAVAKYNTTGCAINSISFSDRNSAKEIRSYINPANGDSAIGIASQHYGERNLILFDLKYSCGRYVAQQVNPYDSDIMQYCYAWHGNHWIYITGGRT